MPKSKFTTITVIVTESERAQLRTEANMLAEGTAGAALRVRAGMAETAHGLVKARREGLVTGEALAVAG
jgi:hypothetical protein